MSELPGVDLERRQRKNGDGVPNYRDRGNEHCADGRSYSAFVEQIIEGIVSLGAVNTSEPLGPPRSTRK